MCGVGLHSPDFSKAISFKDFENKKRIFELESGNIFNNKRTVSLDKFNGFDKKLKYYSVEYKCERGGEPRVVKGSNYISDKLGCEASYIVKAIDKSTLQLVSFNDNHNHPKNYIPVHIICADKLDDAESEQMKSIINKYFSQIQDNKRKQKEADQLIEELKLIKENKINTVKETIKLKDCRVKLKEINEEQTIKKRKRELKGKNTSGLKKIKSILSVGSGNVHTGMVEGDETENEVRDVDGGGDVNSALKNNNTREVEDKDLNSDVCVASIPKKPADGPTEMVGADKTDNEVRDVDGDGDVNSDLKNNNTREVEDKDLNVDVYVALIPKKPSDVKKKFPGVKITLPPV
ncbi:uncharacterized protein LOC130666898 [Microplitis mediator]|uniref:uncharacterized protein LOC130666898 n=1 Tax=Microplitis mediator TaxID=375433 RepID=UPI002555D968|nr:uncharacterized protein LOC130666898 [Microplitis mediator]